MKARAWELLRANGADALLGLLALATTIEVAVGHISDRQKIVPLSFFFVAPLLVRRRFPFAAPTLCFAALDLSAALDRDGLNKVTTPFFAAVIAAVAMGGIPDRRRYAGWAVTLGAVSIVTLVQPRGSWSDELWLTFFFTAAWAVGYAITTRTRQAGELRERAERAERERGRLAEEAVAEERARIARELHDVVAHSVSVMVVQAAGVRRLLTPEQEREREALLVVERVGREALTEMRRMLGVLRAGGDDAARTPQPGLQHLDRLIDQVRRAGLDVKLDVTGEPVVLPAGLDLSAYRIVQEGLTNVLKHGDRGTARVSVRYGEDELELEVIDDTDVPTSAADGQGLAGMRERVAVYGGEFEAGPRDGGGFRVRARLPVAGARG